MVDKNQQIIDSTLDQEYKYGFTTDIEQTTFEPGLNELIKKNFLAKRLFFTTNLKKAITSSDIISSWHSSMQSLQIATCSLTTSFLTLSLLAPQKEQKWLNGLVDFSVIYLLIYLSIYC